MHSLLLPGALVFFLLCMFLVDTLQVLLRAVATDLSAPILGAHLGSIFMLVNRATAALALLAIGYFVDTAMPHENLQSIYAMAAILIAVCHLPLLSRTPIFAITLLAFQRIYGKTCDPEIIQSARQAHGIKSRYKLSFAVASVTAVGLLGLLVPSLLASTFPEYRATLMQTGFILNSAATIANVLYIERDIAMTLDGGNSVQINSLYNSYTVSRAAGYVVAAIAFLVPLVLPEFSK
jgi:hypothetical protein